MPSLGQIALRFFKTPALVVLVLSCFSWFTPVLSSPLPLPSSSVASGNPEIAQKSTVAHHNPRNPVFVHDVDYEVPHQPTKRDDSDTNSALEDYSRRFSEHRDTMREYCC